MNVAISIDEGEKWVLSLRKSNEFEGVEGGRRGEKERAR